VRVAAADLNFDRIAEITTGAGMRGKSQVKINDGATRVEIVVRALTAYPASPDGLALRRRLVALHSMALPPDRAS
jgi:hypothetical protein